MARPESLERLWRSWIASPALHDLRPAASELDVEMLTKVIGSGLSSDFVWLYRRSDGLSLFDGNLNLYPIQGGQLSIAHAGQFLRENGWLLSEEVVVFGDNGQGDVFGALAGLSVASGVIVEVGQIFEPGCMAIGGTSLSSFLLGRSAYYSALCEAGPEALTALHVPQHLLNHPDQLNDDDFDLLNQWADPGRPSSSPDPYQARLTIEKVRASLR